MTRCLDSFGSSTSWTTSAAASGCAGGPTAAARLAAVGTWTPAWSGDGRLVGDSRGGPRRHPDRGQSLTRARRRDYCLPVRPRAARGAGPASLQADRPGRNAGASRRSQHLPAVGPGARSGVVAQSLDGRLTPAPDLCRGAAACHRITRTVVLECSCGSRGGADHGQEAPMRDPVGAGRVPRRAMGSHRGDRDPARRALVRLGGWPVRRQPCPAVPGRAGGPGRCRAVAAAHRRGLGGDLLLPHPGLAARRPATLAGPPVRISHTPLIPEPSLGRTLIRAHKADGPANTPGLRLSLVWTERVTVTLPGHHAEMLRARVAAGEARSVSAQVAAAVAEHLRTRARASPRA